MLGFFKDYLLTRNIGTKNLSANNNNLHFTTRN